MNVVLYWAVPIMLLNLYGEYLNKGVFSNEYYWSTTDAGNGNIYHA